MKNLYDTSFKHFDLPVSHLGRHGHYVPPKARDEAEISRRRALPSGALLAEQQARGTEVAVRALGFVALRDDSNFMPDLLAAAGLNTAWHDHAQSADDVMRRRLYLPVHARNEGPVDRYSLLDGAIEGFRDSVDLADKVTRSITELTQPDPDAKKNYARRIGNSSLVLACVADVEKITGATDDWWQQKYTRDAATRALNQARGLEEHIGANPTLAQLADNDSPLSVYIRRNGTNASVEALEFATSNEKSAQ
jgi:hypothetical protein